MKKRLVPSWLHFAMLKSVDAPAGGWNQDNFNGPKGAALAKDMLNVHRFAVGYGLKQSAPMIRQQLDARLDEVISTAQTLARATPNLGAGSTGIRSAYIWNTAIESALGGGRIDHEIILNLSPRIQSVATESYYKAMFELGLKPNKLDPKIWKHRIATLTKHGLAGTTRTRIENAVKEALDKGLSVDETAAFVKKRIKGINKSRALMIARNEMARASDAGIIHAYQVSKVVAWVSVVGCVAIEDNSPTYHGEHTCNIQNVPIEDADQLTFHINHQGSIVPSGLYRKDGTRPDLITHQGMAGKCVHVSHTKNFDPSQPRDSHGRWTNSAQDFRDDINKIAATRDPIMHLPESYHAFDGAEDIAQGVLPKGGINYCFDNSWRNSKETGIKLFAGVVIARSEIERLKTFDPDKYWTPGVTQTVHAWNVDGQGKIVDKTYGSRDAADYLYYGKELNPADFKCSDDLYVDAARMVERDNKDFFDKFDSVAQTSLYEAWVKNKEGKCVSYSLIQKGNSDSGNFDHEGRPGFVGGSGPGLGSLFAGAGAGDGASKEGKAWCKSRQTDYDSNPEFRAATDVITQFTQGDYQRWAEMSSHVITGEWSERYKDSMLPKWLEKPIRGDALGVYKNYFKTQDVSIEGREQRTTYRQGAEALNKAIATSEKITAPVYRGLVGWRVAEAFSSMKVGDPVDIFGPTSFTSEYKIAEDFSHGVAKGQGRANDFQQKGCIIEIKGGFHGVPVSALSPYKQSEVISSGKFKVASATVEQRGSNVMRTHIVLEQVSVWMNASDKKRAVPYTDEPRPDWYDEAFTEPFLEGEEVKEMKEIKSTKGGEGSGNFGHEGRPGEVGGSGDGDGDSTERSAEVRAWIEDKLKFGGEGKGHVEIDAEAKRVLDKVSKALGALPGGGYSSRNKIDASTIHSFLGVPARSDIDINGHSSERVNIDGAVYHGEDGAVKFERGITVTESGAVTVSNDSLMIRPKGTGIGTAVFAKQVEECGKAGVKRIYTYAVRGVDSNGYYTWPRLGYDGAIGTLGDEVMRKIKEELPDFKGRFVQELFAHPGGAQAWKKHGRDINLSFDPRPGSKSRKILEAYLRERVTRK